MKAVILEAFGDTSNLKFKQIDTPQPRKGEVRIRIKAAGFNPVDYKIREGLYGGQVPMILGADCSGVIDAIDPETKGFAVGDEVIGFAFGQSSNGSYAEFVCLPAEFIIKKPGQLSFAQAAAIPVVGLTAYRALIASRALKKGDTIFIAGAGGGVGSVAVPLAWQAQVKAIYTVAGSEASAQFLQREMKIKREHILLYSGLSTEELESRLIEMNGGRLFDTTFDFVGQAMKRLCLKLTSHSGHFATTVPENEPFDFPVWERGVSLCITRNMSLHFVFIGAEAFSGLRDTWKVYARQLQHFCQLLENDSIQMPPVKIVGTLSVDTVKEAHRLLEEGKVKGKLVMTIDSH